MALEQITVEEVVKKAVKKEVDIPEFQREFVWDPEQVKLLAESLYREYPVGSFLLWDSSDYQETKTAKGGRESLWIIDGQQRITALCLLIGMKPYWWPDTRDWNEALDRYDVMVNLLPEDERMEFALPNPIRRKDPRWVSVRVILSSEKVDQLTPKAEEIAKGLSKDDTEISKLFMLIHARLQPLWQVRKREIPIIKIDHEVEDVVEIFTRLNQAGTRVKETDVVLAVTAARNPGWVREQYLPFRNDLEDRGWDLDAGIFIRTMTGIGCGRARLKEVPKEFWSPENLSTNWKKASDIIGGVLKHLAEFGIFSPDLLPSNNSLIPLFVIHHNWKDKPNYNFNKALWWFLLANRDGRYGGSAITALNEDVKAITEAESFDGAIEKLTGRFRVSSTIEDSEFLNSYSKAGNRFLRLMLYLILFRNEARDWVSGTRIGYDKTGVPLATGFEPQWHHIYPRKILRAAGVRDDEINALANIAVLNEKTNVGKLRHDAPWVYIKKLEIKKEVLKASLISPYWIIGEGEEVEKEKYLDFIEKRARRLAQKANDFLNFLSGENK